MKRHWYWQAVWILSAAASGLLVSAIFAGVFHLSRMSVVLAHVTMVGALLFAYLRWAEIDSVALLKQYWLWGVLGAFISGWFASSNVLSQPASPPTEGFSFYVQVVWLGIVYAIADAMLLSVMPILAVEGAFAGTAKTRSWSRRLAVGVSALAASALVTAAYHWGFPEFRGAQILAPVIGNSIISLTYLLARNPIAPVGAHIAMHIVAVWHGIDTTLQLPPHYT